MTQYLDHLKIGDYIEAMGPKGRFLYQKNKYKKIGMLAGGSGITPMLQVIKKLFFLILFRLYIIFLKKIKMMKQKFILFLEMLQKMI